MTEQQQAACAELARRMGYAVIPAPYKEYGFFRLVSPNGKQSGLCDSEAEAWSLAPNPFTDAAASRELIAWLAADDDWWNKFDLEMFSRQPSRLIAETLDDVLYNRTDAPHISAAYLIRKWFMTAPLPVIAMAAAHALGIDVSE